MRFIVESFFLVFLLLACTHSTPVEVKNDGKIEVHGHRGARGARAENSLPAFAYALKAGVDVLELDLVVTADDTVIVTHDPHVNWELCEGLTSPGEVAYNSLTLNEVKSLRCGVRKSSRFPEQKLPKGGVKIPTLREVFSLVKNSNHPAARDVRFNIETKIVPGKPALSPSPQKFAKLVYKVIDEFGWQNRVILQSFDYRTLKAMKEIDSRIETSQLTYANYFDFVNVLAKQNADYLSPHHAWITKEAVRSLHRVGIRVVPWTANSPEVWRRLVEINVDGIITDHPKALIKYLEENYPSKRRP